MESSATATSITVATTEATASTATSAAATTESATPSASTIASSTFGFGGLTFVTFVSPCKICVSAVKDGALPISGSAGKVGLITPSTASAAAATKAAATTAAATTITVATTE